nr:hypothetical protein CFP56_58777 [Quercus suber]
MEEEIRWSRGDHDRHIALRSKIFMEELESLGDGGVRGDHAMTTLAPRALIIHTSQEALLLSRHQHDAMVVHNAEARNFVTASTTIARIQPQMELPRHLRASSLEINVAVFAPQCSALRASFNVFSKGQNNRHTSGRSSLGFVVRGDSVSAAAAPILTLQARGDGISSRWMLIWCLRNDLPCQRVLEFCFSAACHEYLTHPTLGLSSRRALDLSPARLERHASFLRPHSAAWPHLDPSMSTQHTGPTPHVANRYPQSRIHPFPPAFPSAPFSRSRPHGPVPHPSGLDLFAIHASSRAFVHESLLRLLAAVKVHVLEVEGVDVAREIAQYGQRDIDEQVDAAAGDRENTNRRHWRRRTADALVSLFWVLWMRKRKRQKSQESIFAQLSEEKSRIGQVRRPRKTLNSANVDALLSNVPYIYVRNLTLNKDKEGEFSDTFTRSLLKSNDRNASHPLVGKSHKYSGYYDILASATATVTSWHTTYTASDGQCCVDCDHVFRVDIWEGKRRPDIHIGDRYRAMEEIIKTEKLSNIIWSDATQYSVSFVV